jgi:hypothetical protein
MVRLFCRYDKSQVWLNPKEDYGIRPDVRALVGDKRVFVYFLLSSKSKKKRNKKGIIYLIKKNDDLRYSRTPRSSYRNHLSHITSTSWTSYRIFGYGSLAFYKLSSIFT